MTAYSLQLSCLFVSSGLPVGLPFSSSASAFQEHFMLYFHGICCPVQFVKAVTSCQLTVRKTASSSAVTAACDRACSSSSFCSIHACEVAFNLSVSKPAQEDDCTTNMSAHLHSIAGNSTVDASTAMLERALTSNDDCSLAA